MISDFQETLMVYRIKDTEGSYSCSNLFLLPSGTHGRGEKSGRLVKYKNSVRKEVAVMPRHAEVMPETYTKPFT